MERFQPAVAWAANASSEFVSRVGGFAEQATTVTRKYSPVLVALLTPVGLLPFVLAVWCLGADLGFATGFPVHGVLSRWLIWAAIGALFQLAVRSYRKSVR